VNWVSATGGLYYRAGDIRLRITGQWENHGYTHYLSRLTPAGWFEIETTVDEDGANDAPLRELAEYLFGPEVVVSRVELLMEE